MKLLLIGAFGFAGAIARYSLDGFISSRTHGVFPWGTFIVNATGCFLLGVLFSLLIERSTLSPSLRAGLTTGFVGAYTTFSTFALDWVRMMEDGAVGMASVYVGASVVVGLLFAFVGTRVGRAL
ncbi:MAG: fluoride efflux transporter FluC [Actinomycetota bacterium]